MQPTIGLGSGTATGGIRSKFGLGAAGGIVKLAPAARGFPARTSCQCPVRSLT